MRLVDVDVEWQDRAHFYAIAAWVMRRILVEYARAHTRRKRGGGIFLFPLMKQFWLDRKPRQLCKTWTTPLNVWQRLMPGRVKSCNCYFLEA